MLYTVQKKNTAGKHVGRKLRRTRANQRGSGANQRWGAAEQHLTRRWGKKGNTGAIGIGVDREKKVKSDCQKKKKKGRAVPARERTRAETQTQYGKRGGEGEESGKEGTQLT